MNKEQFTEVTGLYPGRFLFRAIKKVYLDSYRPDKTGFLADYLANKNDLAEECEKLANQLLHNTLQGYRDQISTLDRQKQTLKRICEDKEERIKELQKTVDCLKADMDRERVQDEGWAPYVSPNRIDQVTYDNLAIRADVKTLTDDEAKELLYKWYGFPAGETHIMRELHITEINKNNEFRLGDRIDRKPLWLSPSRNFIAFQCGGTMYELVNGVVVAV